MKLMSFSYTDAKGKKSSRQVLVISEPTDKLTAIDVSESTKEDVAEFAGLYNAALDAFHAEIEALKEQFDLKHNFRQFLANRIEDHVTERL